jgi:dipeptidyl aminopeptidase/acylaminoacyl peptidase
MKMKPTTVVRLVLVPLLLGAFALPVRTQAPLTVDKVRNEFIPHPDDPTKRLEIVWTKPAGDGPWPVIVLIHGHQEPERPGAAVYARGAQLDRHSARGFVAAAVSQPGYGKSDGPPDFCGPRSQRAVTALVEYLGKQPFVDANRIGLYGYSRGAVVASMAATRMPKLAALVLGAGIYDLKEMYSRLAEGIQQNIKAEAGTTDEAFRARSAIFHVDRIKAPTLILHGENDDRATADSARRFGAALEKTGTSVRVVIFPGVGHGIPGPQQAAEVDPFLQTHLLKKTSR